jgi:hypothetical protein
MTRATFLFFFVLVLPSFFLKVDQEGSLGSLGPDLAGDQSVVQGGLRRHVIRVVSETLVAAAAAATSSATGAQRILDARPLVPCATLGQTAIGGGVPRSHAIEWVRRRPAQRQELRTGTSSASTTTTSTASDAQLTLLRVESGFQIHNLRKNHTAQPAK